MPRKRKSNALMRDHSTELINGRSMMSVCLLYDDLEHGKGALRNLLTDYKNHQDEVRDTFSECVENLVEFRQEDKEEVDHDRIHLIKQIFKEMSLEIWQKKRRREKVPKTSAPVEPAKNDEEDSVKEEDEWEKRFASGEFDL